MECVGWKEGICGNGWMECGRGRGWEEEMSLRYMRSVLMSVLMLERWIERMKKKGGGRGGGGGGEGEEALL